MNNRRNRRTNTRPVDDLAAFPVVSPILEDWPPLCEDWPPLCEDWPVFVWDPLDL